MKTRLIIIASWIRARVSPSAVVLAGLLVMSLATAIREHRAESQLAQLRAKYDSAANVEVVQMHDAQGHKLGAALVPQRAGDFFVSPTASSPFTIRDGSAVQRVQFDTTHGLTKFGNGGTDAFCAVGPYTAINTDGAIYCLGNGVAPGSNNYAFLSDGTSTWFNVPNTGGGGVINFFLGNATQLGQWNASTLSLSGTVGAGVVNFGGLGGTTPSIQSGTLATTFTLGTNKAGAVLNLNADANATFASFSGAAPAQSGEIRAANATQVVVGRNAGGTADISMLSIDASNNIILGSGVGGNQPASVVLGAAGGWSLTWSPGTLYGTAGNIAMGTNFGAGATATISAGNGQPVIVASAATAAGTGNTSITGSMQVTTRTITGNLTVDTTTTDYEILANTSGGVITVTLPAPTNGRRLTLVDPTASWSTHNLTLARHGTEKINNTAASLVLTGNNSAVIQVCDVTSDGTNWWTSCK